MTININQFTSVFSKECISMSFTKTSEGRVFFQNADNDDQKPASKSVNGKGPLTGEPVMPKDNTQMQTLLLLKSLNANLKKSKEERAELRKQIMQYKTSIKKLEEKAESQQANYIDLEKTVAKRQNEASKKATRVEDSIQKTLKQIEEAKNVVEELEGKSGQYDETLLTLKKQIDEQKKRDAIIAKKHKEIVATQKEQGEKMVSSVATYVDLTKRISETETRQEALDNKIEESKSEYLKLDRKIDKAIEDRNRILRKVDRIEQAVIETRDALNAKAMVLLTDQGAVGGVSIPANADEALRNADPMAIGRRLEEEALMPWWRKPVRVQGTSLVLMLVIALLLGWIISSARSPSSETRLSSNESRAIPTVSLKTNNEQPTSIYDENAYAQETAPSSTSEQNALEQAYSETLNEMPPLVELDQAKTPAKNEIGIRIHKGYSDPSQIADLKDDIQPIDITDDEEMLAILEKDPDRLAARLNEIEPQSLTEGDRDEPAARTTTIPTKSRHTKVETKTRTAAAASAYTEELKRRISPDPALSDIAKKIEKQAFDGVPEAQHDMGAIYVAGHGQIKQDLRRAVFWFTEAANNGIANAKYNLGVLYHQGLGVEQSISQAITLYDEAADLGHAEAQYNLGIAYIEGIGVPYTPNTAARYFRQAADQGVVEAAYNLGLIYENGLLGETKPDEALRWYKNAADAGSPEAQSALEQLAYSLGIDVNDVKRIVDNMKPSPSSTASTATNAQSTDTVPSYIVSDIQRELMRRNLYPGPVDGMIGPMTRSAIENFQYSAGLNVTGIPSEELLSYLKASY